MEALFLKHHIPSNKLSSFHQLKNTDLKHNGQYVDHLTEKIFLKSFYSPKFETLPWFLQEMELDLRLQLHQTHTQQ